MSRRSSYFINHCTHYFSKGCVRIFLLDAVAVGIHEQEIGGLRAFGSFGVFFSLYLLLGRSFHVVLVVVLVVGILFLLFG